MAAIASFVPVASIRARGSEQRIRSSSPSLSVASSSSQKDAVMDLISSSTAKGKAWWSPLFNFSSSSQQQDWAAQDDAKELAPNVDLAAKNTSDKFRILRQRLKGLDAHHDTMYHSSIASRLATQ